MNAQQCRERMILMQRDRIEQIKQSPEYIDLMAEIEDAIEMDSFCTQYPLPATRESVSLFCLALKSEGFNFEYTMKEDGPKGFISWELPKVEYTIGNNEVLIDSDDRGDTVAKIVYGGDRGFAGSGWVAGMGPRSETPADLYWIDGKKFNQGQEPPIAELVNLAARDANFRRFRGMNFELCPGQYDQDIKDCRFKSADELMKALGLDPDFEYWGSGEYLPRQSGRTTKILVRALLNSQVCPVILAGRDRDSDRFLHSKSVEMAQSINMPIENLISANKQSTWSLDLDRIVMFDHFEY